jgi:hypothetical protein
MTQFLHLHLHNVNVLVDFIYRYNICRFGIGRFTTEEEIDYTADLTIQHVTRLREMRYIIIVFVHLSPSHKRLFVHKSFKRRCGLAMHNDSVNDIDMHDTCMHNAARQWVFDPQPNVGSANNYFS